MSTEKLQEAEFEKSFADAPVADSVAPYSPISEQDFDESLAQCSSLDNLGKTREKPLMETVFDDEHLIAIDKATLRCEEEDEEVEEEPLIPLSNSESNIKYSIESILNGQHVATELSTDGLISEELICGQIEIETTVAKENIQEDDLNNLLVETSLPNEDENCNSILETIDDKEDNSKILESVEDIECVGAEIEMTNTHLESDTIEGLDSNESVKITLEGSELEEDEMSSAVADQMDTEHQEDEMSSTVADQIEAEHENDEANSTVEGKSDADHQEDEINSSVTDKIDAEDQENEINGTIADKIDAEHQKDEMSNTVEENVDAEHQEDEMNSTVADKIDSEQQEDELNSTVADKIDAEQQEDEINSTAAGKIDSEQQEDEMNSTVAEKIDAVKDIESNQDSSDFKTPATTDNSLLDSEESDKAEPEEISMEAIDKTEVLKNETSERKKESVSKKMEDIVDSGMISSLSTLEKTCLGNVENGGLDFSASDELLKDQEEDFEQMETENIVHNGSASRSELTCHQNCFVYLRPLSLSNFQFKESSSRTVSDFTWGLAKCAVCLSRLPNHLLPNRNSCSVQLKFPPQKKTEPQITKTPIKRRFHLTRANTQSDKTPKSAEAKTPNHLPKRRRLSSGKDISSRSPKRALVTEVAKVKTQTPVKHTTPNHLPKRRRLSSGKDVSSRSPKRACTEVAKTQTPVRHSTRVRTPSSRQSFYD